MDGIMARAADASGIQFRLLNRRKGPAVQGPRAQSDRKLYRQAALRLLEEHERLTIIENEVVDFVIEKGSVRGVILADGSKIPAMSVVLTTGTFLRGVIHIGQDRHSAGRMGERASTRLGERLESFGLPQGRLKTGTPPRLDGTTIVWDKLEMQPGDDDPVMFSFLSKAPEVRQVPCGITHTNIRTHEIIRKNLEKSAMYGGQIEGVGPRYCPSIEDKVVRFADKESHQVFLEPEGLDDTTVYPNGISTSLPQEVQLDYVRSIFGLENVRITQPGYAIEYDYMDPRSLTHSLSVRDIPGLFLAGQINGTTGYEEAAAQGLVAGLNAALAALEKDAVTLSRAESYIGVMVDDLVTRGVTEPYRMFTSRAEFRLSLRADNADQRLTPLGIGLGCVGLARQDVFEKKLGRLEHARGLLSKDMFSTTQLAAHGVRCSQDGQKRSLLEVLAFPDVSYDDLIPMEPRLQDVDDETRVQLGREAQYMNYIARQKRDIEALKRDEREVIPPEFDYGRLSGLSNELRIKLETVRPSSLAHAGRIEGMTPAAMGLILAKLRQEQRRSA
jgi:tRNA uridine 5-carboxymethylaminomethyl modification enzyme